MAETLFEIGPPIAPLGYAGTTISRRALTILQISSEGTPEMSMIAMMSGGALIGWLARLWAEQQGDFDM